MVQNLDESTIKDGTGLASMKLMKPWVEVRLIAGQFSNVSDLTYDTETSFIDSRTLKISLKFEKKLQVSLYSEADKIMISLWGVFVSTNDHQYLTDF